MQENPHDSRTAVYRFEECEIDVGRRELRRRGATVHCEPKVYEVLLYLIENAGRGVSKGELREAIWHGEVLSDSVLTRSIALARKAVGDDGRSGRVIATLQRHGYRFVVPIVRVGPEGTALPDAPAMPSEAQAHVFVGRHAELSHLDGLLQQALHGSPQMVWVVGEAGAGKTRLVEEFGHLAGRRGVEVRTGRVPQASGVPPFWLWRDVLGPVLEMRSREQLERDLGESVGVLMDLFHELHARFPDVDRAPALNSVEARLRLFSAVCRFIGRIAQDRPLLLLLEDAQWADPSSLLLLRFLVQECKTGSLMVLSTFRTRELHESDARHELRGSIAEEANASTLELAGLGPDETARLAELTAGRALTPRWHAELVRRTEGNPLLTIELVQLLDRRGALDGDPSAPRAFPPEARATIERRLDLLPEVCLKVLGRAATFGRSFRFDLLVQVSEDPEDAILTALETAQRAHVIESRDRTGTVYQFCHALLGDVVHARMSAAERVALHRGVAHVLEDRYAGSQHAPLEALAHHFGESPFPADRLKAVTYGRSAGDQALSLLAYPEALSAYRRALDILHGIAPVDDPRTVPLLHGLALAQQGAGKHTDAIETYRKLVIHARARSDADLLAQAAIGLEDARYTSRAPAASSIPLLEEALRALPTTPSTLRAQLLERLGGALNVVNDPRRHTVSKEAVAVATAAGEVHQLIRALRMRYVAIFGPDSLEERLAISEQLFALAQHDPKATDSFGIGIRIWGHETRMSSMLEIGDRAAALMDAEGATIELGKPIHSATTSVSRRVTEDTLMAVHVQNVRLFRAGLLLLEGRFSEVEQLVLSIAAEAQRIQAGNVLSGLQLTFFGLRYLQGRAEELLPMVRLLLAQNPGFSHAVRAGLAMAMADLGQIEEASLEIDRLTEDGLQRIPRDGFWISTMAMLSEASFLIQSDSHAKTLYGLLAPYEQRMVLCTVSYCSGSVARYLGQLAMLLGQHERAAEHFETALARNRALHSAPFTALTEYEYALLLSRNPTASGRRRAKELLASAAYEASLLQMRRLERRIRQLQPTSPAP